MKFFPLSHYHIINVLGSVSLILTLAGCNEGQQNSSISNSSVATESNSSSISFSSSSVRSSSVSSQAPNSSSVASSSSSSSLPNSSSAASLSSSIPFSSSSSSISLSSSSSSSVLQQANGAVMINAGSEKIEAWYADTNYEGGVTDTLAVDVDMSRLGSPPPAEVLKSERYGNFTYTIDGFVPGRSHTISLFFTENYWSSVGDRRFDVLINGTVVLSKFDILNYAGSKHTTIQRNFEHVANADGNYVIEFKARKDMASVNAILINRSHKTRLVAPAAYKLAVTVNQNATEDCSLAPAPFTGSLELSSKYEVDDSSKSTIDDDAQADYLEATESIKAFENLTTRWSDNYLNGNLQARTCALNLIKSWAKNNALLSPSVNHVGQAVRKWALATVANSYLKITQPVNAPKIDQASRKMIEAWFVSLALETKLYYSDRPIDKVNNHDYWAAWAVMSSAIATNRKDLFLWSMDKYTEALSQIDAKGYLPNEMKRESLALSYHNYAMHALTGIAALGEANGYSLYFDNKSALDRLAKSLLAGFKSPALFKKISGHTQNTEGLITSYNLAWLEIWKNAFPTNAAMTDYLTILRPMRSNRLGGNLSLLFGSTGQRQVCPVLINKSSSDEEDEG